MDEMAQPAYGMLFQNHLASEGARFPGWGALQSGICQSRHLIIQSARIPRTSALAQQEQRSGVQLARQELPSCCGVQPSWYQTSAGYLMLMIFLGIRSIGCSHLSLSLEPLVG